MRPYSGIISKQEVLPLCLQAQALVMRPFNSRTDCTVCPLSLAQLISWLWRHLVVKALTTLQHSYWTFSNYHSTFIFKLSGEAQDVDPTIYVQHMDSLCWLYRRIFLWLLRSSAGASWGQVSAQGQLDDTCEGRAFIFHFSVLSCRLITCDCHSIFVWLFRPTRLFSRYGCFLFPQLLLTLNISSHDLHLCSLVDVM